MIMKNIYRILFIIAAVVPQVALASSFGPPSCTISASPASITSGGCSTLSWTATDFTTSYNTAFSISPGGYTHSNPTHDTSDSGSTTVCPSTTTTYTGTATIPNDMQHLEDMVIANTNAFCGSTCASTWSMAGAGLPSTYKEFLEYLYWTYQTRPGDSAGLNWWLTHDTLSDHDTIEYDFGTASSGYYPFLGSPSVGGIRAFLTSLYQNIFERAYDTVGYNYWFGHLSSNIGDHNYDERFPFIFAEASHGSLDGREVESSTCSARVTVSAPSCTPRTYCNGGDVWSQDSSCNTSFDHSCSFGCTGGSCNSPSTSCSVTLSPNPINLGNSSTLSYTSSNASWMYIQNVGYMTPNTSGAFSVSPNMTTDYTCTAADSSGNLYPSPASLTVNQTPLCALLPVPSNITLGDSSMLEYFSLNATSLSISPGVGTVPTPGGFVTVSPSVSTTYTCLATGPGGSGSANTFLGVSCTPSTSYSCTGIGGDIITETSTSSACVVTTMNTATCTAPAFCSDGSGTCLYPTPTGTFSIIPSVVPPNGTAKVSWNITGVAGCSVTGTNGDSWSGLSGTDTTSPIDSWVTYTLSCPVLGPMGAPNFTKTVRIGLVPKYEEN